MWSSVVLDLGSFFRVNTGKERIQWNSEWVGQQDPHPPASECQGGKESSKNVSVTALLEDSQ